MHVCRRIGRRWVNALRRGACRRFETHGFPTQQQEEWRDTNVAPDRPDGRSCRAGRGGVTAAGHWRRNSVLVKAGGRGNGVRQWAL